MRIALLAVAVAALLAVAASASVGPSVTLRKSAPLQVGGSGFPRGSAVRVVVTAPSLRLTKVAVASRTGSFVATWKTSLTRSACRGTLVTASAAGRRATWRPGTKSCGAIGIPIHALP